MDFNEIVKNVEVSGLEFSFKSSKYPMSTDTDRCSPEITSRIKQLASVPTGTAHDNFLCGIVVHFDLTLTIKAWTEAERYHWFEIISSQSTMHRISKMNYDECMIGYVSPATKAELERLRSIYERTGDPEDYLRLLYNCPVGLKLTAGMVTNYQQLKTIYFQRRAHRLPEWKAFCEWIETLPYFKELILDDKDTNGGE